MANQASVETKNLLNVMKLASITNHCHASNDEAAKLLENHASCFSHYLLRPPKYRFATKSSYHIFQTLSTNTNAKNTYTFLKSVQVINRAEASITWMQKISLGTGGSLDHPENNKYRYRNIYRYTNELHDRHPNYELVLLLSYGGRRWQVLPNLKAISMSPIHLQSRFRHGQRFGFAYRANILHKEPLLQAISMILVPTIESAYFILVLISILQHFSNGAIRST